MTLRRYGFIVKGPGYRPAEHAIELSSSEFSTFVVGVSAPEEAIDVAIRMAADGVQLIELCGGFEGGWPARIRAAINNAVPVGFAAYPEEDVRRMNVIFGEKGAP